LPGSTEPVSETMSTSRCSEQLSSRPAGTGEHVERLREELGRQLGGRTVVIGVVSAGFHTTVLPAASAG
jgi:hypothetical protein